MEGTNASGQVFCTSPKGKVELEKTSSRCDPSDIGAVRPALVNGGEVPGSKAKNPDQKKRVPFGLTQKESGFRGYTLPHRNVGPVGMISPEINFITPRFLYKPNEVGMISPEIKEFEWDELPGPRDRIYPQTGNQRAMIR